MLDERGYLRITGRLKDMFIVGGFNAYPAEIEQVLATHPGVAQVAVDRRARRAAGRGGQGVRRAATRRTSVDRRRAHRWCRERMANYKVPRSVEFVDALPRNATGKVLKVELPPAG